MNEDTIKRYKDFAEYLKAQGLNIRFSNRYNFEFHATSNEPISQNLIDIFNKFGKTYDSKIDVNFYNNYKELYFHSVKNNATVKHEKFKSSLGGDGMAMLYGIEK